MMLRGGDSYSRPDRPLLSCCAAGLNHAAGSPCLCGINPMQDQFFERHGVKLGFMSAFVKAAADALREVPAVNGVIDGDEIIYRRASLP